MPSFSLRRALVGVLGLAALVAVACGGDTAVAPPQAAQEPAAAATVAATTQSPAAPAAPAAAAPAQAAMPAATVAPAPMRATATPVVAARATAAPAPAAPAPVADPVSVVTTSNIVADWVDVVGGDRVDVNSLLAAGADPHSFNPGARDVANVADADLVMVIGLGLEASWLDDLIKNAARDEEAVIELGDAVDALPFEEMGEDEHDDHDEHDDEDEHGHDEDEDEHDHDEEEGHDEDEDEHDHDEEEGHDEDEDEHDHDEDAHDEDEDEHDHDEEEGHDEDEDEHDHDEDAHDEDEDEHDHDEEEGHDEDEDEHDHDEDAHDEDEDDHDDHGHGHHHHGEFDPHFWFDPIRVKVAVNEIAEHLSEVDPAGAAVYSDNAAAYSAELDALHAWIEEQVAQIPAERRALVTSHDSFAYFAALYGFRVVGTVIPGLSTEREPSAQEIAGLVDTIRDNGIRAIFAETTVQDSIVQSVARETGASVATLYTGSLGAAGSDGDTYIRMVRANTMAIVDALR